MRKSRAKFIIKTGVETMERVIKDKKELVKLVSFLTMCDGGLYIRTKTKNGDTSKCNPQFIMNHTSKEFIKYATAILENVTTVSVVQREDYNTDGYIRRPQLRLTTKRHPFFKAIWQRLYKGSYKTLDVHVLKYMDEECLAMLYMANGSIGYKGNAINSVSLNTKRLTEGDNRLLADFLLKKFGIQSTINRQRQYTYIRIKGKSIYKFFKLITPFILKDFNYKIPDGELLLKYKQEDDDIVRSA